MQQNSSVNSFSGSDSWVILSPIEQSIKRKIESVGTPLSEWDINIYRGVLTGYNEAFIITTDKRNQLLASCKTEDERSRTAELIRPILRGRDIKRYGYDWANLWLIYIPWHFPMQFDNSIQGASPVAEKAFKDQYPVVYAHMLQYKKELSARNKAETGIRYEWYAMQRWGSNYWDDFNKPKIIWKRIGSILRFSYDEAGVIGLDSTCFATGQSLAYVCCVLNSKMGHYLLKDAPKTGTGDLLISVQAVDPIRIPLSPNRLDYLEELLKAQVQNCTDENDKLIDEFVYNLYNLTTEEITFVNDFVTEFE